MKKIFLQIYDHDTSCVIKETYYNHMIPIPNIGEPVSINSKVYLVHKKMFNYDNPFGAKIMVHLGVMAPQ